MDNETRARMDAMTPEERDEALANARERKAYWDEYIDELECLIPSRPPPNLEAMNPLERAICQTRPIRAPLSRFFGRMEPDSALKGE